MARRKDSVMTHVTHDGDHVITESGHKILSLAWYNRMARAAMEERDFCTAWQHFGAALSRTLDPVEMRELKLLEKKAYKLMLNRKSDRKKDKDKRKRRDYA